VVPSWPISYSKEEVAATSKSREQREGAETIEGGHQEEGSISKATPEHQKRMEAQVGSFSFELDKVGSYGRCFAIALRKNMADILSSPLGNFGLELCFWTHKLSEKTGDIC
jgi:hypothetical protein